MDDFGKVILLIFVILYVVSPVDLCPGPIDDILLVMLTMASGRRKGLKG